MRKHDITAQKHLIKQLNIHASKVWWDQIWQLCLQVKFQLKLSCLIGWIDTTSRKGPSLQVVAITFSFQQTN